MMDRNMEEQEDDGGFDFQLPIQQPSRPISRMSGDLAFSATLVHIDETDIDENLMAVARNLGLEIPEEPFERKPQSPSPNISAVTVSSTIDESSLIPSRTSASTRPTSVGSDDGIPAETLKPRHVPIESLFPAEIPLPPSRATSRAPSRAPSLAPSRTPSRAPSITPSIAPSTVAESVNSNARSVFSTSSRSKHSSVASSFTRSLRRLSGLSRKKSVDTVIAQPESTQPTMEYMQGRTMSMPHLHRPSSAGGMPHALPHQLMRSTSTLSAPPVPIPTINVPRRTGSMLPSYTDTRGGRVPLRRPLTPTIEEEDMEEIRLAQDRSLRNSHLQKLRTAQLEEQARFVHEQFTMHRKARDEAKSKLQKGQDIFEKRRDETIAKHDGMNAELETRHLHAELELERHLASQRRACETKLKYMEAYCYGKRGEDSAAYPDDANYPARRVTEDDYRKLVEQYHLRNGMDTLHQSRINVLREQQAQQAARISMKQDDELEALESRYSRETNRLRSEASRIEEEFRRQYSNKKSRLIWRWKVKEAIERRRLELERGKVFGELPEIPWPVEQHEKDDMVTVLGSGQRLSFLIS